LYLSGCGKSEAVSTETTNTGTTSTGTTTGANPDTDTTTNTGTTPGTGTQDDDGTDPDNVTPVTPQPETSAKPNILLIISDDQGLDSSAQYSFTNNPPKTPVLDALASSGLVFENAWATPGCYQRNDRLQYL